MMWNQDRKDFFDERPDPVVYVNGQPLTDSRNMSDEHVLRLIGRAVREHLCWDEANARNRTFWRNFERQSEPRLVLRVCEELRNRGATASDLADAAACCAPTCIQAVLHYMDYLRARAKYERHLANGGTNDDSAE